MSKKRKTRRQKEVAHQRHLEQIHVHPIEVTTTPIYSIRKVKIDKVAQTDISPTSKEMTFQQKDIAYMKHDIFAISAASGIVAAFDILLFVLLTTGALHLHFLGY